MLPQIKSLLSSSPSSFKLMTTAVLLLLQQAIVVEAASSGYLMDPMSRSSMWRLPDAPAGTPVNNNDIAVDCGSGGGLKTQYNGLNKGRCGPCGDEWSLPQPRANEERGTYYGRGLTTRTYTAGNVVNMTVNLVTSMLGYFEFRLCAYKKTAKQLVTQGCFDRHLLESADGSGQTRFPIGENQNNTLQTVSLKLPDGNVYCQYCVIQWRYRTGNSVGVCEDGSSAMGCGDQTEFRNCADVAIEPLVTSGYIVGPASRSVIAAAADSETGETNEVDKQLPGDDVLSLDCGGQWAHYNEVNDGRCGECGDEWMLNRPRPNEEGGQYSRGIIANKYTAGDVINVTVFLTKPDYGGYFDFRLCADKADAEQIISQECFDRNLLQLVDDGSSVTSGKTRFYVNATTAKPNSHHRVSIQLPLKDGIDCKNCVIQWRYRTGHESWGTCEDGTFAMGCGAEEFQQEIRNCADVTIVPRPLTETAQGMLFFYSRILKF